MAPLLDVQQLSLQFAGRIILKQLSLTVAAGTVVSVLGSNGAGKSTLLKAVMGLHDQGSQQSGLIRIDGHDLIDERNFAQARQQALSKLAYVPELPAVYPHLSAVENIRYFLGVAGVPETAAVESCLQCTGLDSEAWHRPCNTVRKPQKRWGGYYQQSGHRHSSKRWLVAMSITCWHIDSGLRHFIATCVKRFTRFYLRSGHLSAKICSHYLSLTSPPRMNSTCRMRRTALRKMQSPKASSTHRWIM